MEPYLGQILAFAFNYAPNGWMMCQGQLLAISQYSALYSLLGITYGGNGMTTFALPDLRGRAVISFGQGPGLTNHSLGESSGVEQVTLTANQLPAHNHAARAVSGQANQRDPGSNTWAQEAMGQNAVYSSSTPNVDMAPGAIAPSGGGQAHSNMQPHLVLNCCIAIMGVYPVQS